MIKILIKKPPNTDALYIVYIYALYGLLTVDYTSPEGYSFVFRCPMYRYKRKRRESVVLTLFRIHVIRPGVTAQVLLSTRYYYGSVYGRRLTRAAAALRVV